VLLKNRRKLSLNILKNRINNNVMTAVKLNAFLSLIIASFFVGIAQGMDFADIINSLQQGIGSTLGSLILIIAFGFILGNILSDSGAAQRISSGLISFLIWTDI
jgi:H+/gluconate symporter-like permease